MRVGLVQQIGDSDRNICLDRSIQGIREAASEGAQLVLLQELHAGLYFCQTEDHAVFNQAESIPGPSTDTLSILAKELKIVIVCSLFERRAAGLYHNTAVVIESDGTLAGKYRKMHIPDDPGFYEKFYFTPGDLGFKPIDTSVGKLGVLVCWDQWYPEAARLMALAGADILLYPTAIGWVPDDSVEEQQRQREAWMTIQRAHAIANGLPVMVANRVGFEAATMGIHEDAEIPQPTQPVSSKASGIEGITFYGSSFIAGPQGEFLAQAPDDKPCVLVTEIDKQRTETVRRFWPYLRDRRIDAYVELTKRYID